MARNNPNFDFNNDYRTEEFFDIFKQEGAPENDATINEAKELYATMGLQMEYTDSLREKKDNRKLAAMQFVEIDPEKSNMITQRLMEVYGPDSFQVRKWYEQLQKIELYKNAQRKAIRKRKRQLVIMAIMCVISVALVAGIVIFALNSTTYYINQGDYNFIYRKTMFGSPEVFYDVSATGLIKDGSDLYFLGKNNNQLYRMSTSNREVKILTSNEASSFRIIGGNVYYVNESDGKTLYRVSENGGDDEKIYEYEVYGLNKEGNTLKFYDVTNGKNIILDVNTMTVTEQ